MSDRFFIAKILGAEVADGSDLAYWKEELLGTFIYLKCIPRISDERKGVCIARIPYFNEDLNAMYFAEEIFRKEDGNFWGDDWKGYLDCLSVICLKSKPSNPTARATAGQRSEVFVMYFKSKKA